MAETAMGGFWEIGAYRTNVKRIRDGMEQIEELSRMAKERAEIEKQYVRSLQVREFVHFKSFENAHFHHDQVDHAVQVTISRLSRISGEVKWIELFLREL